MEMSAIYENFTGIVSGGICASNKEKDNNHFVLGIFKNHFKATSILRTLKQGIYLS